MKPIPYETTSERSGITGVFVQKEKCTCLDCCFGKETSGHICGFLCTERERGDGKNGYYIAKNKTL